MARDKLPQKQRGDIQMTSYSNQAPTSTHGDSMSAFYSEISSLHDTIMTFNDNVACIAILHSKSLDSTDNVASQRYAAQLKELVGNTSALSAHLKRRIMALEGEGGSTGQVAHLRKQQIALVRSKFVEAIQNYHTVEQRYREKNKQRMERQYKIVKPDATPEEVRAVVNNENGGQIFSQALMNSDYGVSRAAYLEVQERHEEIKRIERTLSKIAQLFNDMDVLSKQQGEIVDFIQTGAASAEKDMEAGLQSTEEAVKTARKSRTKRWICFFIGLGVAIIVAVVIVVLV